MGRPAVTFALGGGSHVAQHVLLVVGEVDVVEDDVVGPLGAKGPRTAVGVS